MLYGTQPVFTGSITKHEYDASQYNLFLSYHLFILLLIRYTVERVTSKAPKLSWNNFAKVLKVFLKANQEAHQSEINEAFKILDQQATDIHGHTVKRPDHRISPDEFRAFLSILLDDEVIFLI